MYEGNVCAKTYLIKEKETQCRLDGGCKVGSRVVRGMGLKWKKGFERWARVEKE